MDTQDLAYAFCAWPLPPTVCADLCATDATYAFPRSGTNLLTVAEAKAMFDHLVEIDLLSAAALSRSAAVAHGVPAGVVRAAQAVVDSARNGWPGDSVVPRGLINALEAALTPDAQANEQGAGDVG